MLVVCADSAYRETGRGLYFTLPQLRTFCLRSGLKPEGKGDHFKVKGIDGSWYEFSTLFYEEKKDAVGFDEDTFYYLRNGRRINIKN